MTYLICGDCLEVMKDIEEWRESLLRDNVIIKEYEEREKLNKE